MDWAYTSVVAERDGFLKQLAELRAKLREKHDFSDFRDVAMFESGSERPRT